MYRQGELIKFSKSQHFTVESKSKLQKANVAKHLITVKTYFISLRLQIASKTLFKHCTYQIEMDFLLS